MKNILLIIICFLISLNTNVFGEEKSSDIKGSLVIVGGRLEPDNKDIYNKFIELAMKYRNKSIEEIKIGIVPAGSSSPVESGEIFKGNLVKYNVPIKNIVIIPLALEDDEKTDIDESKWKDNGTEPAVVESIKNLDAIWFVGGDQARYGKVLFKDGSKTPLLEAIWDVYRKGAVLGGTSAGAAIMSDPMIGGGESLPSLNYGSVKDIAEKDDNRVIITKGPGFFNYGLVDQHFSQRGRLGRLIVAALDTNNTFAFGIDENSGLIVNNMILEVLGENGVTFVNLEKAKRDVKKTRMSVNDVLIGYFEKGDKYNLKTGEYIPVDRKITENDEEKSEVLLTSIFDRVKDGLNELYDSNEITGTAFELKNDKEGIGFIVKFRKDKDTKIYRGEIKDSESLGAINIHMDIIPVKITITEE